MSNKKKAVVLGFFIMMTGGLIDAKQEPIPKDPYASMRYTSAFNQNELFQEYKALMHYLGCAHNVFTDTVDALVQTDTVLHTSTAAQQLAAYQDACLQKLHKARMYTLAEPGIFSLIHISCMIAGAAIAMKLLGQDSAGGSFAGFTAIFDSLTAAYGAIRAGCNLVSWPDNPLAVYEERFACNKCFIPRVLWPKIVREFMLARQDEFTREKHIDFLNFALGFTLYKPHPPLPVDIHALHTVKDELHRRIDLFFRRYMVQTYAAQDIWYIKINVEKFIDQLVNPHTAPAPRYVYLHGSGGVGKTYFVEQLWQWIEELLPGVVNFQAMVIHDPHELEGTDAFAGALLKLFYNQLRTNKRGSMLILDEAAWLNDPGMIAHAKRTFNLDQSKLCTTYFGEGSDGQGVSLVIPPVLIFVASNEELVDSALASRFDSVRYPLPSKELLVEYALNITHTSELLRRHGLDKTVIDIVAITQWIDTLAQEQLNFRFIAGNVEGTFLQSNACI